MPGMPHVIRMSTRTNPGHGTGWWGSPPMGKKISFVAAVIPDRVTIGLLNIAKKTGAVSCRAQVLDSQARPVPNRKIYYGIYYPESRRESQGALISDAHGEIAINSPILPYPE